MSHWKWLCFGSQWCTCAAKLSNSKYLHQNFHSYVLPWTMLRYIVRAVPHHSRGFHIRIGDHLHSPTIAKLTPSLLHRHAIPHITVHPAKATFHSTARNEGGPLIPILASMFKVRAPTSPSWINSNGIHFSIRWASRWLALQAELHSHSSLSYCSRTWNLGELSNTLLFTVSLPQRNTRKNTWTGLRNGQESCRFCFWSLSFFFGPRSSPAWKERL